MRERRAAMNRIRLGILGTSWWTDIVYPGFSRVEDVEITYISARTAEKAEKDRARGSKR